MIAQLLKRCSRCHQDKPLDNFPVTRSHGTLMRRGWCQPCLKDYYRAWKQRYKQKAIAKRAAVKDAESSPSLPASSGFAGFRPLPAPTSARPGSEAKIAILAERADAGVQLWHPLDNSLITFFVE